MFKKFFTIVIIPRKTSEVKKIRVKVLSFTLAAFTLLCLVIGFIFITHDYINRRSQITGLNSLQKTYLDQKRDISEFLPRYEDTDLHFELLKALNHKLKAMISFRTNAKPKNNRETLQAQKEKLEIASKEGVLSVIDSASDKIDSALFYRQEEKFNSLMGFLAEKKNPLSCIPHGWPVRGFLIDEFGMQNNNFSNQPRTQYGINIATRIFYPVYALADGIVILAKKEEAYGNLLVIDHGNGFVSRYGHIAHFEVEEGDVVRKNKIIAQVGNTGRTRGPRLYYEILFNGIPQNPVKYIL